jgi:exosortase
MPVFSSFAADRDTGSCQSERVLWPSGNIALSLGLLVLALPVIVEMAREEWITDQGSQGPIMLFLGLWLMMREWPLRGFRPDDRISRQSATIIALALIVDLAVYVAARMAGQIWLSWMTVILAGVWALYHHSGSAGLSRLWFPILFLALLASPPGLVSGPLVGRLNTWLAHLAVLVFSNAGVEATSSGSIIYVGPYEMLMTDACAGMGSLLSLFAIGMLYLRLRHGNNWRYMAIVAPFLLMVAIFANLGRVMLLMLVTLTLGDRAAQGWFHPMAGLILFAIALITLICLDAVLVPWRRLLERRLRD